MCFPGKRQKYNFAGLDRRDTKSDTVEPSPAPAPSALALAHTPIPTPPSEPVTPQQLGQSMLTPRVAIVIYSLYGHIAKLAEAVKSGVTSTGGSATIYQIQETLSEDVLRLVRAPPRLDYPILLPDDLVNFDAFLFGVPTRYGIFPAFWDATGPLWSKSALAGKMCGVFVSTGTQGGGQEVTIANTLSTFVHHGMIYVPLGFKHAFSQLSSLTEIHGGSPWGVGTFVGMDGSRQPSKLELEIASLQGKGFWDAVSRCHGSSKEIFGRRVSRGDPHGHL